MQLRAPRKTIEAVQMKMQPHRVQQQEGVLSKVWARSTELCIERAQGMYVYDVDGNRYADLAAGIAVTNTGHCHPHVVRAVQEQAAKMLHCQINNYHNGPLYELTRRLGAVLPEGVNHIYYDNTGTAGIEAAVKMVRQATQRPNIITLFGGMHGRSAMCSAMTTNHSIRNPVYYPLPSGVYCAPFPTPFRWGCTEEEATERALSGLHDVLRAQVRAEQVAAVIFEPILGEGGFYPVTREYYRAVRELCNEHGMLLIMDEVQAGYGRSGKMWGHQHFSEPDTHPDVIVASKGLASGMPLSVVAATEKVMDTFTPGTHGGTFNGNPVSLAAAIATLDVFENENLVQNSARQGAVMEYILRDSFGKHMPRAEIRGKGLMLGIDCVDDQGRPSAEAAQYIKTHCLQKSNTIVLMPTGFDGNILRVMPPLIIDEVQATQGAEALGNAVRDWRNKVSLA
eukprot:TRINITY_DN59258_c0_g1_i1.p1 TRINITY_DN59258_c0_g1~~TRINITY_DN59258_c0_g1_i1.p1  ORF type:complete len:530 (+),score=199.05 TRINITY_DN59258_c0_g1_i1:233-1591(+)